MNDKLTDKHIELLYEATELHLKWYQLYYKDPPKFDVLLELNHTKLGYLIDETTTEKDITERLISIKAGYQKLVDDYTFTTDKDWGIE
jgi:hypothetical protein